MDIATDAYELINRLVQESGTDQMPNPYRDICYLNKHGHWEGELPLWLELLRQHFKWDTGFTSAAEIYALRYEIEWLRRNSLPVADLDQFHAQLPARSEGIEQ
jgi:hypothetical protein